MIVKRPGLIVVDDEPDVLRSVHDLLRKDFRVQTFTRPSEALEALREAGVAVVLTDQRMPEMTGVAFLAEVKRLRPETTRLIFTGYSDYKALIDAINEGNVFRYISKPWEPEELVAIIRQAAEHHDLIVEKQRLMAELKERNDSLQEANRLKRNFIEVASHELNTPVAVVLGMAELWRMTQGHSASPLERAWLDRIQAAGKRLAATVERMLKLLRCDQFDRPLSLQTVEIEPLIHDAIAGLQPFLEARRQRIDLRIAPDLGAATVDPAKVGDILVNLIVNAIKFTPDGGVILVDAESAAGDCVSISVTDQGPGIGAVDRPHLFEPFFTGSDTRHHSSGEFQFGKRGIGLGLCLVKSFVELHGGQITVTNAPERGAVFQFVIPRRPVDSDPYRAVG